VNQPPAITRLRVLLVENHEDTLRWLTLYLEDSGHAVTPARTLREASSLLSACGFEVLLSDIGLPDGSGWDLLRQARPPATVFAIAMSGSGISARTSVSRDAGYRYHLVKPFKTAELDKLLFEALSLL
jgi:two-component system CheB/CheR fusion protein